MATIEQHGAEAYEQAVPLHEDLIGPGPLGDYAETRTLIEARVVPASLIQGLQEHVDREGQVEFPEWGGSEAAKVAMIRKPREIVFVTVFGNRGPNDSFVPDPDCLPRVTILRGDGNSESIEFSRQRGPNDSEVLLASHYAGY